MVMLDVKDDLPLKEPVTLFKATVTSMVGLAGTYTGLVSVHCPLTLSTRIASNMLGMEVSGICDDVNDAMGEIANMLGGDIKHMLSKGGMDINLSIPTVIYGEEYTLDFTSDKNCLIIPFTCNDDRFLVAIRLHKE
jgi:chemotaxis protein CheX